MVDWQERITHETSPAIRIEHTLRYQLAGELIRTSGTWLDVGCGAGVAAAAAIGGRLDGRAVLVDASPAAVEAAEAEIQSAETVGVVADLSKPDDVARVREALLTDPPEGDRCATCFELIEHLENFVPAVELLVELAEREAFTVLLSVPNDAFWTIENVHHETMWGEGAFEELRRLLPDDHVAARQLALSGSAIVPFGDTPAFDAKGELDPNGVPSHMIIAFGPRAEVLRTRSTVVQTDIGEQRRWERQRESDLAFFQAELFGRPEHGLRARLRQILGRGRR